MGGRRAMVGKRQTEGKRLVERKSKAVLVERRMEPDVVLGRYSLERLKIVLGNRNAQQANLVHALLVKDQRNLRVVAL